MAGTGHHRGLDSHRGKAVIGVGAVADGPVHRRGPRSVRERERLCRLHGERVLDSQGHIEREGSLGRISHAFRPVVASAHDRLLGTFGARLHSAYLHGSVPRGTARVGRSDLLLVLNREPGEADRAEARALDTALDKEFRQINGSGTLLSSRTRVLSDLERYDLGWFVACLCTPLRGEDLAECLPQYRPSSLLARETNGDLALCLVRWREGIKEVTGGASGDAAIEDARRSLVRGVSRRLVRTGFTLVMPRWNGWTSDLPEMAEVFERYYPERAGQMRSAAAAGYGPTPDMPLLHSHVDDLGPWLAEEHTRVHGVKAPRPGDA